MSIKKPTSASRGDDDADLLALARVLSEKAPFGIALLDDDLRYILVNQTLAGLHGVPEEAHQGRSVTDILPHVSSDTLECMRHVLATGEPITDRKEITRAGRSCERRRFWNVSYRRVDRSEGKHALAVIIQEITDREEALRRERDVRRDLTLAAGHVARLQAVTSALAEALTRRDVARVAVTQGVAALGGVLGSLLIVSRGGDALEVLATQGIAEPLPDRFKHIPLGSNNPLCQALRAAAPEWLESHEQYAERYPEFAEKIVDPSQTQAIACVPLILHGKAIGVLGLSFDVARGFDDAERFFMMTFARQCAQALDRARLYEAERRANERLTILAEVSGTLAESLDYETTLSSITRAVVPRFADACSVDLLTADGELSVAALAHVDKAMETKLWDLRRRYPTNREHSHLFKAITQRRSILVPRVADGHLPAVAINEEHLARLRAVRSLSYLFVPLFARGQAIGVLTFSRDHIAFDDGDDLALAEDIARRAALAIDSAKLYREAQEASRSKDEFLSVLSHELRTPLNAILGWATILAGKHGDPDRVTRGIEVIERNARAQVKIIEDILDVSRIITGKLRLERRPLDLEAVLKASIEVIGPTAYAKQVDVVCACDAPLPRINGDPDRLQQVAWNLLSNAVKFTPKGGRVELRVERANAAVVLRVSDTGPGISPDFLPYVFDRFRQADSSSSRSHGGLGLGLAIVRHLVEMHGGSVSAESPGALGGATLTVTLPASEEFEAERDTDAGTTSARISLLEIDAARTPADLRGLRVLVVDDELDARDLIASSLADRGADVCTVASASEALAELPHFKPDVIVSDIGMPGEDGHSLLRRVRSLPPPLGRIPAVALTAYARPDDARRAFLAGFQMHVSKPVEPAALATVVANLGGRVSSDDR